jgi:hypothetical protein
MHRIRSSTRYHIWQRCLRSDPSLNSCPSKSTEIKLTSTCPMSNENTICHLRSAFEISIFWRWDETSLLCCRSSVTPKVKHNPTFLGKPVLGSFHVELGDVLDKCKDGKGECDQRSFSNTRWTDRYQKSNWNWAQRLARALPKAPVESQCRHCDRSNRGEMRG